MRLVHQYLLEAAQRYPEKDALICDESKLSYREFVNRINTLSTSLTREGLHKGDRALILLNNRVDFLIACYAVIAGGAIAVPIPEGAALTTIQQVANDCSPLFMITSSRDLVDYPLLRDKLSCRFLLVGNANHAFVGSGSFGVALFDKQANYGLYETTAMVNLREDDGAFIFYVSGRAAKMKGVLLSHRNLIQVTKNINDFMKVDANTREFAAISIAHSVGLERSHCMFFAGGTLVVSNAAPNPFTVVDNVQKHNCDALALTPSIYSMFLGRLGTLLDRIGTHIRYVELVRAPMPIEHKRKMLDMFPNARIYMHYGLPEASRSTFIELRSDRLKLDTAGRQSPNVEVAIYGENGEPLKRNVAGEIAIRGSHVSHGYWHNDELTSLNFTNDRWFKTGDVGFFDDDGYLHVLGRKDDMISMDGVMISPLEIEDRIRETYPYCEICVVGVPDPAGFVGEIPVLCYISRDGSKITPSELSGALSGRLDRNKIPRVVYRVEQFPRLEDTIWRKELRRQLLEGVSHAVPNVV